MAETEQTLRSQHSETHNCNTCAYGAGHSKCKHKCTECNHKSNEGTCLCFTQIDATCCEHYEEETVCH